MTRTFPEAFNIKGINLLHLLFKKYKLIIKHIESDFKPRSSVSEKWAFNCSLHQSATVMPSSALGVADVFHFKSQRVLGLLCECVHAKSLQSSLTVCDLMDNNLPRLLCPWDSPGYLSPKSSCLHMLNLARFTVTLGGK